MNYPTEEQFSSLLEPYGMALARSSDGCLWYVMHKNDGGYSCSRDQIIIAEYGELGEIREAWYLFAQDIPTLWKRFTKAAILCDVYAYASCESNKRTPNIYFQCKSVEEAFIKKDLFSI